MKIIIELQDDINTEEANDMVQSFENEGWCKSAIVEQSHCGNKCNNNESPIMLPEMRKLLAELQNNILLKIATLR